MTNHSSLKIVFRNLKWECIQTVRISECGCIYTVWTVEHGWIYTQFLQLWLVKRGNQQERKWQQRLARMWGKRNPYSLLMEVKTVSPLWKRVEVSQKARYRTLVSLIPTAPEHKLYVPPQGYCTSMWAATQVAIAKNGISLHTHEQINE